MSSRQRDWRTSTRAISTEQVSLVSSRHCVHLALLIQPVHLYLSSGTAINVDSARANLAGTFVNAFVNAGFGNDKLMVEAEEGNSWIYKNKDHGQSAGLSKEIHRHHRLTMSICCFSCVPGMMSATASLGLSLLWDTDVGLSHVDKYMYSSEEYIKAGAVLATGILHAGVRSEVDAAFALLSGHVESKSVPLKISAIIG
jgi:26S proteasome regulatory subunit N1